MSKYFKLVVFLIVLIGLFFFLQAVAPLVKILIISALLAYILNPLSSALQAQGFKNTSATLIVFLSIMFIVGGFVILILPAITSQMASLQGAIESGKAQEFLLNFEKIVKSRLSFLGVEDINFSEKLNELMGQLGKGLLSSLMDVVSILTNLILIPFIMFFLLKDGADIKKGVIELVPNRYFEFALTVVHKMDQQLGNYLRGQFMDALVVGLLSVIALWILDVNYFFVIGAIAGIANLIPYVGPLAGAIPAIIVSVMQVGNLSMVPWIALAFVIVQLLDNVLVQPLVVAKTVNIHPLIVLLVVIIGGQFFGILGMILAVPATGVIQVVGRETYRTFKQYRLG